MDNQTLELLKETIFELKKDLREDVKGIKSELSIMRETLQENHESWVEHMKRTTLNEMHINKLEEHIKLLEKNVDKAVEAIEPHIKKYDRFLLILKASPFIAVGSGVLAIIVWTNFNESTKTLLVGIIKNLLQ